jgi:hypothetical protein
MFTFKRFKPKTPALCICGERPPAYPDKLCATCHDDRDSRAAVGYYHNCPSARVRQ